MSRGPLTLSLVLVLGLSGCGGGEPEAQVPAEGSGQALFLENCAECHGEDALGNGPTAPTLPVQPPSLMDHLGHHAPDQLVRIIMAGVPPAMPPAPLSEDEVQLVVDYVWTLVPDTLVDGLREMQRMMEMGMEMDSMGGMGMPMDSMGGMPMDSTGGMPTMGDSADHSMPRDTLR